MNLLGTFINVLRLQLVEFFPRFYSAKGIELKPLSQKLRLLAYEDELSLQLRHLHTA
jgi:vacuolar-type H+-ATPase subunit I/STV1